MTKQELNSSLVARYHAGDRNALDELVQANEGLIRKITRKQCKVQPYSVMYDDCLQEGRLAVMIAADRYDSAKSQFSTYVSLWIYAMVSRFSLENAGIIRTPVFCRANVKGSMVLARESRAYGGHDSDSLLRETAERETKDEQIGWLREIISFLPSNQQRVILHDLGWATNEPTDSRQNRAQHRAKAMERLRSLAGVA